MNVDIYVLFPKSEVEKQTDGEFEILRVRLRNTRFVTFTSPSGRMFPDFWGVADEDSGREKEIMALFKRTAVTYCEEQLPFRHEAPGGSGGP